MLAVEKSSLRRFFEGSISRNPAYLRDYLRVLVVPLGDVSAAATSTPQFLNLPGNTHSELSPPSGSGFPSQGDRSQFPHPPSIIAVAIDPRCQPDLLPDPIALCPSPGTGNHVKWPASRHPTSHLNSKDLISFIPHFYSNRASESGHPSGSFSPSVRPSFRSPAACLGGS